MTRTLSLALAALLAAGRQRLGAGEIHLRAELVRRRRPCRLLGGARQGLLQGQGPRRDPGELQGLGRFDRQGRHRPRRCGPGRRRRGDRLGRPRHHHQDGRHGVRQDAAQHLQPQEQAARQAQGSRRHDPGRASGRQPAPDVPGLRQGERHRCLQGHLGQYRARRQDRRRRREAHGRRRRLHRPACRSTRRRPARATW